MHFTHYGSQFKLRTTNLMLTLVLCVLSSPYIFCTRDESSKEQPAFCKIFCKVSSFFLHIHIEENPPRRR